MRTTIRWFRLVSNVLAALKGDVEGTHSAIFELKRAFLATRKFLNEQLEKYDITLTQFDIIDFLGETEQRVVQVRFGIFSACLTRAIEALVYKGLVWQRESPKDTRVKLVGVNEKAKQIIREIKQREEMGLTDKCVRGFTAVQISDLEKLLHHIAVNMGDKSVNIYK